MAHSTAQLVIGVDTHADRHVAVALDTLGRHLATASFAASDTGNARLLAWACQHGQPVAAGVEGTGSFGYRLARYLLAHGVAVREVNRPTGPGGVGSARTTPWMPSMPPGPCWPAMPAPSPRTATASWGSCAVWSSPAAARSRPAPRPPTSSGLCWSAATTPSAHG
jgi:Transposase